MSFIDKLQQTVAHLRSPGGCPWDKEQTHQSLTTCLIEESSELLEAIDESDPEHMREELGDVLLQVVMHAQIAKEAGYFDFEAVAKAIDEKLIRRHPHVFGERHLPDSAAVLDTWDDIKAVEKKARGNISTGQNASSLFKDLPPRLSALLFARSVYKQVVKKNLPTVGLFDTSTIERQSQALNTETAGRKLFEAVGACYQAEVDPEIALRDYADKVMKEIEAKRNHPDT